MTKTPRPTTTTQSWMSADEVITLSKGLSAVQATGPGSEALDLDSYVRALCDLFLSTDDSPRHEAIDQLRAGGLSADEIIDHVVPAIARLLGVLWFDDKISFVHVTIGTARLQETVRALSVRQKPLTSFAPHPPVLVVLPKPEQHTLGAFIAAEQFRRLGYRVDIAVDETSRQIADRLKTRRYALVGITASSRRTLASTKELVEIIRGTVTRVTPIVVGGSILETETDVVAQTNADFIAHDARTALEKCGLSVAKWEPSPKVTADHVD